MSTRPVLLVSPQEPSGVTWLINCFLELGIRTFRSSHLEMWQPSNDRWHLSSHEQVLRKWLPSLSDRDAFEFREDLSVRWTHEWPADVGPDVQVLLFVRDPRDAFFSRFRRDDVRLEFPDYMKFLDPITLLDKVDTWLLFCRVWALSASTTIVRFEDYKRDADATLRASLAAIGVTASDAAIAAALAASSFERAAEGERRYRDEHPEDRRVINRAGVPGEWRSNEALREQMTVIEKRCGKAMARLGYAATVQSDEEPDFSGHLRHVPPFLPRDVQSRMAGSRGESSGPIGRCVEFALTSTADQWTHAGLSAGECANLHKSLRTYTRSVGESYRSRSRKSGFKALRRDAGPIARIMRRLGVRA